MKDERLYAELTKDKALRRLYLGKATEKDQMRAFQAITSAFEDEVAQNEQVPGCEDCAYNGRYLCDEHGPQPAGVSEGARVDDEMILRACNAYDAAAVADGEELRDVAQFMWMHAALEAALHPEQAKDGDV